MAVLNVIRYPTGLEMEIPPVIPIIFLPAQTAERKLYPMDLKELNYVVTVANEGSVSTG